MAARRYPLNIRLQIRITAAMAEAIEREALRMNARPADLVRAALAERFAKPITVTEPKTALEVQG